MDEHHKSTPIWPAYLGAMIAVFTLIAFAEPVGNYFENSRYFIGYLFIPGFITILVLALLQKFIHVEQLLRWTTLVLAGLSLVLGIIVMMFCIHNGDNVLYIVASTMVYHPYLFSAVLSATIAGFYLASICKLKARCTRVEKGGLKKIGDEFAKGAFLAFLFLEAARLLNFWALLLGFTGFFGILLSISLARAIGPTTSPPVVETSDSASARSPNRALEEEKNEQETRQDGSTENGKSLQKRTKRTEPFSLAVIALTTLVIGSMFLWRVELVGYDADGTQYFIHTPTRFLDEIILSLIWFLVIYFLLRPIVSRLDRSIGTKNSYRLAKGTALAIILLPGALAFAALLLLHSGFSPTRMGYTRLFYPWIFLGMTFLVAIVVSGERKKVVPKITWLFVFSGFLGVLGYLLSNDPDESYPGWLFFVLFGSHVVFMLLYLGVSRPLLSWKIQRIYQLKEDMKAQVNDARMVKESPTVNEGNSRTRPALSPRHEKGRGRASSRMKTLLIIGCVLSVSLPLGAFFVGATSNEHFQLVANIDGRGIIYLADPTTRIDKHYMPRFGVLPNNPAMYNNTITIRAAKNEWEPVQLVLRPINQDFLCVKDIVFSGFAHENNYSQIVIEATEDNHEIYNVKYLDALNDVLPDPLEKFSPIVINDGQNHPIWINFRVPANASSGTYKGTLTFMIGNQSKPNEGLYRYYPVVINVILKVLDFRLPTIPSLKSNFGFWGEPDEFNAVVGEMFSKYRMMHWSHVEIPRATLYPNGSIASLNFTTFDAKMNEIYGYGTTTIGFHFSVDAALPAGEFIVNGIHYTSANYSLAPTYNETFRQYFSLFAQHAKNHTYVDDFNQTHSWFDDMYFVGRDELDAAPQEVIQEYLSLYHWLKEGANMTFPIMQTTGYHEEILDAVDIWCKHGVGAHEQEFVDWQEQGKEMWLYTTRGPRFPNPSLSTSGFSLQSRAIAWQCFVFNYTHYLIWDIATPYNGNYGYGYQGWNGGTIMYKINGEYLPSIRMELTREGFEDYEYFNLLKRSVAALKASPSPDSSAISQGEQLLARVNGLFPKGYNTIEDYRAFNVLREDIADYLDTYSILK